MVVSEVFLRIVNYGGVATITGIAGYLTGMGGYLGPEYAITAEEKTKHQKNGNVHRYVYYHCTKRKDPNCNQSSIKEEELEKQIKEIVNTIEIPSTFHEWAMNCIKEENKKESESRNYVLESQHKAYKDCVKKGDALINMRANDELTKVEFINKRTEWSKEKFKLEELIKDTSKRIDDWVERAEDLFSFAETAKKRFETGDLVVKRQILSCLGSNLFLNDGKLSVSLQKPLLLMKRYAEGVQTLHERLEPVKNHINKGGLEVLYAKNPVWGG